MSLSKEQIDEFVDNNVYNMWQLSQVYHPLVDKLVTDPDNVSFDKDVEEVCFELFYEAIQRVLQRKGEVYSNGDEIVYSPEFQDDVDSMFKSMVEQQFKI